MEDKEPKDNGMKSNASGVMNNMLFKPAKKTGPFRSKQRRHLTGDARMEALKARFDLK